MAPSELREYRYAPLLDSNSLRVLALRPAHEDEEEIDCEIVDIPLPDKCTEIVEAGDCFDEEFRERRFDGAKRLLELGHGDEWSDSDISSDESVSGNSPVEQGEGVIVRTQQGGIWEEENTRQQYEALSWCWGHDPADEILRVHNRYGAHAIRISRNLKEALRVLRKTNETRHLWVDAICIDQKNIEERNEQVARMDKIYGRASNVCIWLGEASDDSALAIDFIRDRVLELWKFDELIEDRRYARYWAALLRLMRRPWFSRRWVVQEIALSAHGGTIYCGSDHVTWREFSDAVSLFVEVESATHRLSDVMKLDMSFGDIPNYLGDVSSLGAALLVDATSNLFRRSASGERQPLSSLEYLVSRMSAFKVTQPRDAIYALLAISRDGETQPPNLSNMEESELGSNIPRYFETPPYSVDYKLPIIDSYQKFVQFCIERADSRTALNVLVRPWAPIAMESDDDFESDNNSDTLNTAKIKNRDREIVMPSWICSLGKAAFEVEEHPTAGLRLERQNANPLVSFPNDSGRCVYSAAGETGLDKKKFQFIKWDSIRNPNSGCPEYSMVVRGFVLDEVFSVDHPAANGNIPYRWLKAGRWQDTNTDPPESFWRTLVADRGLSSKDPPIYFARACKESMKYKAKTMSKTGGYVDCRRMIEEGRCTIVAQFLRRVQEVVWNKHLITTKGRRLGLVGNDVGPNFKVSILYGCSVPVILEEVRKSPRELAAEKKDRYKQWRKEFERVVSLCQSKYRLRALRREKAKERPIEVQVPANLGESLQWLGRQRKPSWPLRPTELLTCSMLAPLGREIMVKSPDLRRDDALVTDGVVLSGQKMPSNAQLSAEQPALPYGLSVLLPSEVEYRNGKRSDLIHSSSDRSRLDSRSVAQNLNKATERISLEKQESNEGERSRVRTQEEEQRRADEHARGREEFNARKSTEKHRNVPQPSYYRLFGECYIHGMMNGEAIKFQKEKNIPVQVFELR